MRHGRRNGNGPFIGIEAGFTQPLFHFRIGEDPSVLRGQGHADGKERGEGRGGVCGIGHHIEDEDASAGTQGACGAAKNIADLLGRFLMECPEDRHGVVGGGFVFVGMVIAGAAFDAILQSGFGHAFGGHGGNGGNIDGDGAQAGIGANEQLGVGGRAAGQIEKARTAGEIDLRHDGASDRHGAAAHRECEPARAFGILAEMQLGRFDGFSGLCQLCKASPLRIDVLVVANGLGEIGGGSGDERKASRFRISVESRFGVDILLFENEKDDSLELNSVTRLLELLKNPQPGYLKETAFGCIANAEDFMGFGGSLYKGEITIDDSCYDTLTDNSTDEEVAAALNNAILYNWNLQTVHLTIDKEEWVGFWRRYNLLQFFSNSPVSPSVAIETIDIDRDEVKLYYPGLEDIVDLLLDNNIKFGLEGDVDLTDSDGIVLASAGMLIINPSARNTVKFGMDNKVFAIKGKMGNHVYFSFSIEPSRLLKIGYVLHRNSGKGRHPLP